MGRRKKEQRSRRLGIKPQQRENQLILGRAKDWQSGISRESCWLIVIHRTDETKEIDTYDLSLGGFRKAIRSWQTMCIAKRVPKERSLLAIDRVRLASELSPASLS